MNVDEVVDAAVQAVDQATAAGDWAGAAAATHGAYLALLTVGRTADARDTLASELTLLLGRDPIRARALVAAHAVATGDARSVQNGIWLLAASGAESLIGSRDWPALERDVAWCLAQMDDVFPVPVGPCEDVAEFLASRGRIAAARRLLKSVEEPTFNTEECQRAAIQLARLDAFYATDAATQSRAGEQLYKYAIQAGDWPVSNRVFAAEALQQAYGDVGPLRDALEAHLSLAVHEAVDVESISVAKVLLAGVCASLGDLTRAEVLLAEAATRGLDPDIDGERQRLWSVVLAARGATDEAIGAIAALMNDDLTLMAPPLQASILTTAAWLYSKEKCAAGWLGTAERHARRLRRHLMPMVEALLWTNLGRARARVGRFELAFMRFKRARVALDRVGGDSPWLDLAQASTALEWRRDEEALVYVEQTARQKLLGAAPAQARTLLGRLAVQRGDATAAVSQFRTAAHLHERLGEWLAAADALGCAADAAVDDGIAARLAANGWQLIGALAVWLGEEGRVRQVEQSAKYLANLWLRRGLAAGGLEGAYSVVAALRTARLAPQQHMLSEGVRRSFQAAAERALGLAVLEGVGLGLEAADAAVWRRSRLVPAVLPIPSPRNFTRVVSSRRTLPNVNAIRRHLRAGEAAVEWALIDDAAPEVWAFVVTANRVDLVRSPWLPRHARALKVLSTPDDRVVESPIRRQIRQSALRTLSRVLLDPLERQIVGVARLWIAASGPLVALPIAGLTDRRGRALLTRAVLCRLNTLAELCGRRLARPRRPRTAALLRGSDENRSELPVADREIAELALRLPGWGVRCLVPEIMAVEQWIQRADVIHYAGHGGNGRLMLGGVALSAVELAGLKLPRRPVVILSACEAGRTDASGQAIGGLVPALLNAGAQCVICTVAPTADDTAFLLVAGLFYQWLVIGLGLPDALQNAQIELSAVGHDASGWSCFGAPD
jgi:hypothetical protein